LILGAAKEDTDAEEDDVLGDDNFLIAWESLWIFNEDGHDIPPYVLMFLLSLLSVVTMTVVSPLSG